MLSIWTPDSDGVLLCRAMMPESDGATVRMAIDHAKASGWTHYAVGRRPIGRNGGSVEWLFLSLR